jgi:transposase InsO family protein
MLVELGVVEQRYRAVLEVLEGLTVTDVARRYGVSRQTVHVWLRRYGADGGLANLADRSSRPHSCPHQMPPAVEARVVGLREQHPRWGPTRIRYQLQREGLDRLPGRSSVYRALVRHGLIDPKKRRRRRGDYRRWERGRAMELWQMDVMGGVRLVDGVELKVVTGIDDHSRFLVCARVVARATARPVCDALLATLKRHGVPEQILTDNGKVFTGRFGPGGLGSEVMFDRICAENGIRHLLTAPRSPTTTGKVERLHKTIRSEFLAAVNGTFATLADAQAALDGWVQQYNHERPHQALGMHPPVDRFRLAATDPTQTLQVAEPAPSAIVTPPTRQRPPGISRWVDQNGVIRLAGFRYRVGATFAGEQVEVVCTGGLVEILHRGVLVTSHAQRRPTGKSPVVRESCRRRARQATSGPTVTRSADGNGSVSFAGTMYRAGRAWAHRELQVAIVADSVQLSCAGTVVRVHPIRHDRAKEHGAFATPHGRPRKRPQDAPDGAGVKARPLRGRPRRALTPTP